MNIMLRAIAVGIMTRLEKERIIIIENNEEEVKMLNKNFVKLGLEELDYIMDSPNYTTTQVDDLNNSEFRSYLEKALEKIKSEEEIKPLIEKMLIEFFDADEED